MPVPAASSLQARQGRLAFLKTSRELQATEQTINVYTVEIPPKAVNGIVNHLRAHLPPADSGGDDLQHLRRVARPEYLPAHLRRETTGSRTGDQDDSNEHARVLNPHDDVVNASSYNGTTSGTAGPEPTLYLLLCPASAFTPSDLCAILSTCYPFHDDGGGAAPAPAPHIQTIPVPRLPPASQEQASYWSEKYWPTVYKGHNPFGPHPAKVLRAEAELQPVAGAWMALAQAVALEAQAQGDGEPIGAVIVDRNRSGSGAVVVAGDARWYRRRRRQWRENGEFQGKGNVAAHAVMRAIALVARRRREQQQQQQAEAEADEGLRAPQVENDGAGAGAQESSVFLDTPLIPLEREVYPNNHSTVDPKGYLCVGLEIYVTHEPCVMCSMALLHSRFDRVVFGQRMPLTGGLCADISPSSSSSPPSSKEGDDDTIIPLQGEERGDDGQQRYGLFWRPELNWRFFAWRWEDDDLEGLRCRVDSMVHP
ncbi:MAG: tRNA-specific adenosine deaminase subunit tad3 [Peltula sp. TS41687]|nr:MAG: tRNA-specific adenosine deaminase subunit tad3 [Peltula sp. TS41687]